MIKGFKILLILLLSNGLYCQIDSIKLQILNYRDSKSTIISKGRSLLLDNFIDGDLKKVRDIKKYLIGIEDDNYFAFYPPEYWFILYWTKDYAELSKDIQRFDNNKINSYNTRVKPLDDILYIRLKEKSLINETDIKNQIEHSEVDNETKQILNINLDRLLLESRYSIYAQDSLNEQADNFLAKYPQSRFAYFTKNYVIYKQVPRNWGVAVEFFSGYGIYTGNLSRNFTNNIPIGVAFDICYKNFELYLRDYIGFNKTKKDFDYSAGTWKKNSSAMAFLPEASLGYVAYNDDRFKLSPFAGIGSMYIGPSVGDTDKTPELEEVALKFSTTYILGINLDIKFGEKHPPKFMPKTSYPFIRIRYGYSMPQFEKKYSNMTGNMHYITIGFGVIYRKTKREY